MCESPGLVSLPKLIEEDAAALRKKYLAFVFEIGETVVLGRRLVDHLEMKPGLSYWWSSLIAEKSNWAKSASIVNVIRFYAFESWVGQRTIRSITVVSGDRNLAKCIELWCKKRQVTFKWQREPRRVSKKRSLRHLFGCLPLFLQAIVWLGWRVKNRWHLSGQGLSEWRDTTGKVTLISYLFNLSPEAAKAGVFKSPYWDLLPDSLINNNIQLNILHLYMRDGFIRQSSSARMLLDRFNETYSGRQVHVSLDSFCTFRVLSLAIYDWIRIVLKNIYLCRSMSSVMNGEEVWAFLRKDYSESIFGVSAVSNALQTRLFESALRLLPRQSIGCYLQENMDWEFSLIQNWRLQGHGKLIGIPHSSVRYWDLRYFFDTRSFVERGRNSLPRPDCVAVNGPLAMERYLETGYPMSEIVLVEGLRYFHLADRKNGRRTNQLMAKRGKFRLLVLGDYLMEDTVFMMDLLSAARTSFPAGLTITVKPHPACPIHQEDYPMLEFESTNDQIGELLPQSDVAYTSLVSSSALDAYCSGLAVISALDPRKLNMSPLRGIEGVMFVTSPAELAKALEAWPPPCDPSTRVAKIFSVDREIPAWKRLLSIGQ
jgi:surface carbohydrate biosynthesis protein (TIGR04326 family)